MEPLGELLNQKSSFTNGFLKNQTNLLIQSSNNEEKQPPQKEEIDIIDVWASNLEEEMNFIVNNVVPKYSYIAMDTEFPGVVAKPVGNFRSTSEYHYQTLRCNVNLLKIIQLGLTFSDKYGNLPDDKKCTWQFHFKFNIEEDMYAQDSIDLLTNSGIDFQKHQEKGIDVEEFGQLLMTSGIVLNEEVSWISFHSAYDFGYLLKILTCSELPTTENEFFELLYAYFPKIYDIKYLMKSCENLKGGLNQLADDLSVERVGPAHQAGSDSLLTLNVFFKMMEIFFQNNYYDEKFLGILYGLGKGFDNQFGQLSSPTYSHFGSPAKKSVLNSYSSPKTFHLNTETNGAKVFFSPTQIKQA